MNLTLQANNWLSQHNLNDHFALLMQNDRLTLLKIDEPKLGGIYVDFLSGVLAHRRMFGGGRGEAIAKAVGIKGSYLPTVIDATAGLGRDAFVLASLGCKVTMFERHPVVIALLNDGLQRAYQDQNSGSWFQDHLLLQQENSSTMESYITDKPDVIYLDPMFPHRQKSALVKKEMRVFQQLVGSDNDASEILNLVIRLAKKRIVVKRPDYADHLAQLKPSASIKTKNHRFDIYAPKV